MILWALRNAMIGAAIGFIAFSIYTNTRTPSASDEPARAESAAHATVPERDQSASRRSMTIPASRNGHYELDARVNGKPVRFVVDTGATNIVLRREDAERVGLHVRDHNFTERTQTANGVIRNAPVVLRDLRVGSLTVRNIEASVNGGRLHQSLLGMDFLRRLNGYEVADDKLILYW